MTTMNLLWPQWAELAAHLNWRTAEARGFRSKWLVRKAGALLANRYGREQSARSAQRAWEALYSIPPTRELWARPRRMIRTLFGLALVVCLSELPATASPLEARDDTRAATEEEEPGRLYQALGWAAFGVSAGDFASTELVLAEGGRELNPFMQRRGVRIGASIAYGPAMNYLTEELRKDGHPKLALWMRIAVVGLKGYAVYHNLRQVR